MGIRLTFILPASNDVPVGGFKIIYQYANALTKDGYDVTICYTYSSLPNSDFFKHRLGRLKHHLFKWRYDRYRVTWFRLDPRIKLKFDIIGNSEIPDGDVVIATTAPTATFVSKLSAKKGSKFYFIQSYEAWWYHGRIDELEETYRLGLNNMVISQDLFNKVFAVTGKKPYYLPNFYMQQEFFVVNNIKQRRNTVALLNHQQLSKRTAFGIKVLKKVKKEIPDLRVELFGTNNEPENLPSYFRYTHRATSEQLRESIYGQAKVYLLPSVLEGWGLTGMEAMASGAVLVASNIGGIEDYANDTNSILVPPDDIQAFSDAVIRLLRDDEERVRLADKASLDMQNFTLKKSKDRLEEIIDQSDSRERIENVRRES
ncbi:glycosyltransferase family 4 protein [Lacticaseibacillus paracasei]|uniref:Glycosyltransferase family 4 protein n=1 Tax=Lacticaseibacillus paracasei TaxID=1597 RepID=A0ABD7BU04_LACPA|nr:glycosyltransferase family 4 protein [Lacticaseibacillus paracasei]MBM6640867.1 glycosyltransferase family 4 protein [Lacticaseibacillus paracasei]OUC67079.1 glycosyltransferase [Lacticaseibacillus paracasei]QOP55903.1 glycosyltransferase family 4 protein [Lacticaseibacillus paracasei]QPC24024.1 glycosyltransferase family 4 protein [Lacticaseibacillus paracasei subsp. tolerans]QPC26918.1 glycosyltransferase family 4 protein [Lacticaseibacillus paracasei subsp. tolerans]